MKANVGLPDALASFVGIDNVDVEVVDGDTLRQSDGTKIRMLGIDAPELHQTCTRGDGVSYRCGESAKSHLEELVGHRSIRCVGAEIDGYGRRLRTCYSDGDDLNEAMVRSG